MNKKTARSSSTPVFIEPLEQRTLLSASPVSHTLLHLTPGKTPLGKDFTKSGKSEPAAKDKAADAKDKSAAKSPAKDKAPVTLKSTDELKQ